MIASMKQYLTRIFWSISILLALEIIFCSLQHNATNEGLQNPAALNSHGDTSDEGKHDA